MDFGGDHFGDLVPQVAEPNQETDNRGSGSFVSQFIEAMPFMGGGFSHEDGEYVHSESTSPAPSPSDRPSNKRKANDNAALDDAHRFARRHRSVGSSNSPGSSIFHSPPQATPFTPLGLGVGTSASPESRLASSSFGGTVPGAGGGGVSGSGGGLLAHGNHPLARGLTSSSLVSAAAGPAHGSPAAATGVSAPGHVTPGSLPPNPYLRSKMQFHHTPPSPSPHPVHASTPAPPTSSGHVTANLGSPPSVSPSVSVPASPMGPPPPFSAHSSNSSSTSRAMRTAIASVLPFIQIRGNKLQYLHAFFDLPLTVTEREKGLFYNDPTYTDKHKCPFPERLFHILMLFHVLSRQNAYIELVDSGKVTFRGLPLLWSQDAAVSGRVSSELGEHQVVIVDKAAAARCFGYKNFQSLKKELYDEYGFRRVLSDGSLWEFDLFRMDDLASVRKMKRHGKKKKNPRTASRSQADDAASMWTANTSLPADESMGGCRSGMSGTRSVMSGGRSIVSEATEMDSVMDLESFQQQRGLVDMHIKAEDAHDTRHALSPHPGGVVMGDMSKFTCLEVDAEIASVRHWLDIVPSDARSIERFVATRTADVAAIAKFQAEFERQQCLGMRYFWIVCRRNQLLRFIVDIHSEIAQECSSCGEPAKHVCPSCGVLPYCSDACQAFLWPAHVAVCRVGGSENR
eukprot:Rmarinus@m.977